MAVSYWYDRAPETFAVSLALFVSLSADLLFRRCFHGHNRPVEFGFARHLSVRSIGSKPGFHLKISTKFHSFPILLFQVLVCAQNGQMKHYLVLFIEVMFDETRTN